MAGTGSEKTGADGNGNGKRLSGAAFWVAAGVIAVYVVFVFLGWSRVTEPDAVFNRRLNLIGGLEAIAFAAAGALFGTAVQRQATKKAEDQADQQKERADENQADAEKGRALEALARSKRLEAPARLRGLGEQPADQVGSELQELITLAEQYDRGAGA